jgi:DNA polymerase-3 subunit gamma/tau
VSLEDLSSLLKKVLDSEKITYDEQSINIIARAGEGSVRDTLSIADRCVSFAGSELTMQKVISVLGVSKKEILINLTNHILNKNIGDTLVELDRVLSTGISPLVFSNDLIAYFKDLLLVNALGDDSRSIVVVKDDIYEQMKKQSEQQNYNTILKAIEVLSAVEQELRYSAKPRIVLEITLIKVISESSLLERVEKLEEIIKNKFPS